MRRASREHSLSDARCRKLSRLNPEHRDGHLQTELQPNPNHSLSGRFSSSKGIRLRALVDSPVCYAYNPRGVLHTYPKYPKSWHRNKRLSFSGFILLTSGFERLDVVERIAGDSTGT